MVPRGEVGIVVANLALAAGVVDAALFAVMLVAVVMTTVVAPYLLAWVVPRAIGGRGRLRAGPPDARRRTASAAAEQAPLAALSAAGAVARRPCVRRSTSISAW